jgi:putative transposase
VKPRKSKVAAFSLPRFCLFYRHLNPVRAGMVENAGSYRWSSYGAHALGQSDKLIRDHACYRALGATDALRHAAYQALFRHQMDEASLKAIRESVNSGTALGSERFKDEIEATLARLVRLGTPGRPRKKGIDDVMRQCDFNLMRK